MWSEGEQRSFLFYSHLRCPHRGWIIFHPIIIPFGEIWRLFFRQNWTKVILAKSAYTYDIEGFLVFKSIFNHAVQRLFPKSLREFLLILSHYLRLAGHPVGRNMYNTIRRSLYWLHMDNDFYDTFSRWEPCLNHTVHSKHKLYLPIFQPKSPLSCIKMYNLAQIPKTKLFSQFIFSVNYRYSKLKRAILTSLITAPVF